MTTTEPVVLDASFETDSRDRDRLISLCERRCRELEAAALPLGHRLYAEAPRQFTRRIQRYWRAWERNYRDTSSRK